MPDSRRSPWTLRSGVDPDLEELLTTRLVEHNKASSAAVRQRYEPDNLQAVPVAAYAVDDSGALVGGCTGSVEQLWHWLTVDTMWVAEHLRRSGLGRDLVGRVETEGRRLGCRWSKLNTFDFQAPEFYAGCGYTEYGREVDYPPGHVNHLMRKDL